MVSRILLLVLVFLSACVAGAPLGFSGGNRWATPVVGPLEDGPIVVPVKIRGTSGDYKGPYLFVVDPDAAISSIDAAIVSELKLFTARAGNILDERDIMVQKATAEVPYIAIGDTLTVRRLNVFIHPIGAYATLGRQVRGVLGRDVIADSLVFEVDRDQGMAYLSTQSGFPKPIGAKQLSYRRFRQWDNRPRRRLVTAEFEGKKHTVHIDLGSEKSMLWPNKIEALQLSELPQMNRVVDEIGTARIAKKAAVASTITAGPVEANTVVVIPYADKRTRPIDLDGSLGMNVFARYNLAVNWHEKTLWLRPRAEDVRHFTTQRIARWGSFFEACKTPACVTLSLKARPLRTPRLPSAAPGATKPAPIIREERPRPNVNGPAGPSFLPQTSQAPLALRVPTQRPPDTLVITREPRAVTKTYGVLLAAISKDDRVMPFPYILVTLNAGAKRVEHKFLSPIYRQAARFEVIDISPFPRPCRGGPGCIWEMPKLR